MFKVMVKTKYLQRFSPQSGLVRWVPQNEQKIPYKRLNVILLLFLCIIFQTKKAMEVGRTGRMSVEDIIFLIRKDAKKYSRVKELLMMNEELRRARKAFDEIKYVTDAK